MFEYHQPLYHHLFLVVLIDSWHAKEEEKDEKEEKLEMEPGGNESSNHKLILRFYTECKRRWQIRLATRMSCFPQFVEKFSFLALVWL